MKKDCSSEKDVVGIASQHLKTSLLWSDADYVHTEWATRKNESASAVDWEVVSFASSADRHSDRLRIVYGMAVSNGGRFAMEDASVIIDSFGVNQWKYFAIFDGFNGEQASNYAKHHLHQLISARLEPLMQQDRPSSVYAAASLSSSYVASVIPFSTPGIYVSAHENVSESGGCLDLKGILHQSFHDLDAAYEKAYPTADDGSTALVCIQAGCGLHIAHIGDTRAVMATIDSSHKGAVNPPMESRCGTSRWPNASHRVEATSLSKYVHRPIAIRLTCDHKPNREDERARIEQNGGHVMELGCSRVGAASIHYSIAVSRAFGSYVLKRNNNIVSCDPEYCFWRLSCSKDQFVVMASDGLWDVISDQTVCDLIWQYLGCRLVDTNTVTSEILEDAARNVIDCALREHADDNITCIIVYFGWMDPSA